MNTRAVEAATYKALGQRVQALTPVVTRGFTAALGWQGTLADGTSVFIKSADQPYVREKLEREIAFCGRYHAPFIPALLGTAREGDTVVFIHEDITGSWPPPWDDAMIPQVSDCLATVATYPAPDLPTIEATQPMRRWKNVVRKDYDVPALAGVPRTWLEAAMPTLLALENQAVLEGTHLVHLDLRAGNICITGHGVVLIDWDHASRGSDTIDRMMWLVNLYLEGGPKPWEQLFCDTAVLSVLAGFFADDSAGPNPAGLDPAVRLLQAKQCAIALEWLRHVTTLPPLPSARSI